MPFFPAGGSGGGGGASAMRNDQFTATAGQTVFNLSVVPTSAVIMTVNGVVYDNFADFGVVGAVVTWTDAAFVLQAGDDVQFFYVV